MELLFSYRLSRFIFVNPLPFALNIVVCNPLFITCYYIFKERLVRIIHFLLRLVPQNGNYLWLKLTYICVCVRAFARVCLFAWAITSQDIVQRCQCMSFLFVFYGCSFIKYWKQKCYLNFLVVLTFSICAFDFEIDITWLQKKEFITVFGVLRQIFNNFGVLNPKITFIFHDQLHIPAPE